MGGEILGVDDTGGPAIVQPAIFFGSSTTYTIPVCGLYRISCLGAGGSGAAIFRTTNYGDATGGDGGAFAEKLVWLNKGDRLTIVVGAGGAAVVSNVSGTGANGNAGGASSVKGPGVSLYCPGGAGGTWTITASAGIAATSPAKASGGDINSAGGRAGYIGAVTASGKLHATGGGSAGSPFGDGGRGGDITSAGTGNFATGGGGPRFRGGDATTGNSIVTGGAGTGSNGSDDTATPVGGANALGFSNKSWSFDGAERSEVNAASSSFAKGFDSIFDPFRSVSGGCNYSAVGTVSAGPGAGGSGVLLASTTTTDNHGGVLGGGGASIQAGAAAVSGDGGIGAGGGAAAAGTTSATSGKGGNGLVTLELLRL